MPKSFFDIAENIVLGDSNLYELRHTEHATSAGAGTGYYLNSYGVPLVGRSYRLRGFRVRRNTSSSTNFTITFAVKNSAGSNVTLASHTFTAPALGEWVEMPAVMSSVVTDVHPTSPDKWIVTLIAYGTAGTGYSWDSEGLILEDAEDLGRPLADVVKLEVETDPGPGVLVNEIANPSGEQGGYGWVTPVPNSVLIGTVASYTHYRQGLMYIGSDPGSAGGQYFHSEMFEVAAAQHVAAFWHVNYTPYGYHRARIEWFTAALAANGTSAYTSFTDDYTDCNLTPVQAPANTSYARIRFEVGKSGGVYPNDLNNMIFSVRDVTVAQAATSAELASVRTNLVTNPSFETNATGWSVFANCAIARSTAQFSVGAASLALTSSAAGSAYVRTATGLSGMVVSPNLDYTVQWRSRAATVERIMAVGLLWYDAAGVQIGSTNVASTGLLNSTSAWVQTSITETSPANAARLAIVLGVQGTAAAGEVHYVDAVMVEQASSAGTYFDGASGTVGTISHSWTGTAHASTSKETDSNLEFIEPVAYVNILGDTHEIAVTREELNVGTIAATVVNPALDPSVADTLRPGRRFRLTAHNPATGVFEPLIHGKVTNAKVDYFPLNPDERSAKITLSGVDNIAALANAQRPSAVDVIDALPYVLEGCGVPWNCNGSGQQAAGAAVIVVNDNASALDQVALTRDTVLGFAWLDRFGVLQAHDTLSATVGHFLDEAVYNPNIVIDFDTDRCINSVTVRRQWTHPTEGPQETVYGPYEDAPSIAEWGRHSADFSVAGTATGSIPTYAASILAANKDPQVSIRSVQVPIMDNTRLAFAFADLYDLAGIENFGTNGDGYIYQEKRITSIKHSLVATEGGGAWLVDFEFAADGGVATPTVQPPLANASVDAADGTWIVVGSGGGAPAFQNSWTNYGAPYATAAFMRKNGVVYLRGLVRSGTVTGTIFTLPVGYRPANTHLMLGIGAQVTETTGAASAGTAHTHSIPIGNSAYRINLNADGTIAVGTGSNVTNGFVSLSAISFIAEQ